MAEENKGSFVGSLAKDAAKGIGSRISDAIASKKTWLATIGATIVAAFFLGPFALLIPAAVGALKVGNKLIDNVVNKWSEWNQKQEQAKKDFKKLSPKEQEEQLLNDVKVARNPAEFLGAVKNAIGENNCKGEIFNLKKLMENAGLDKAGFDKLDGQGKENLFYAILQAKKENQKLDFDDPAAILKIQGKIIKFAGMNEMDQKANGIVDGILAIKARDGDKFDLARAAVEVAEKGGKRLNMRSGEVAQCINAIEKMGDKAELKKKLNGYTKEDGTKIEGIGAAAVELKTEQVKDAIKEIRHENKVANEVLKDFRKWEKGRGVSLPGAEESSFKKFWEEKCKKDTGYEAKHPLGEIANWGERQGEGSKAVREAVGVEPKNSPDKGKKADGADKALAEFAKDKIEEQRKGSTLGA